MQQEAQTQMETAVQDFLDQTGAEERAMTPRGERVHGATDRTSSPVRDPALQTARADGRPRNRVHLFEKNLAELRAFPGGARCRELRGSFL